MSGRRTWTMGAAGALVLALSTVSFDAEAAIVREGAWPSDEETVSLELGRVTRGEALRQLAEEADWSLVFESSEAFDGFVVVDLRDVPASVALDAILSGSDWTARRDGNLVRIAPSSGRALAVPAPPSPPPPPASVAVPKRGGERDVAVTGESVRIAAGDTVRDVTVLGGEADIEGHLTGDLAVVGGSARIREGAHVEGDANAIGGSITIDEGARVDGEVSVVGGVVQGAEHARGRGVKIVGGGDDAVPGESLFARASKAVSNAISSAALLFVFGAVLIALAGDRFDQLRGEIAARPMKSIAMGLVGGIASLLAMVVVAVTVIGIPFAAVGAILFLFAVFAGTAAAATTAGAAIAGHRFQSPYAHLAVGCVIYLVAGLIPWVGGWVQLAMVLGGFGAIVTTRAAGLIRRKQPVLPAASFPYR